MKKRSVGSITIYLSMVLVLVLVLVCTLIESGRIAAINTKLRSITYMGVDSVFSEFAAEVFDAYGVMMLWMDEEELISEFEGFVRENIDVSEVSPIQGSDDLYQMEYVDADLSAVTRITDEDGEIFRDQVSEYMQLSIAGTVVQTLLSGLNIFDQGGLISNLMDKIEEYEDVFAKVEDSVSAIKETVDKLKTLAEKPSSLVSDMKGYINEYLETSDAAYVTKFKSALGQLKSSEKTIREYFEKIRTQSEEYISSAGDAQIAVDNLEEYLNSEKDNYEGDIYSAAAEQVDEIKECSADLDADHYNVLKTLQSAEKYLQASTSLESLSNNLSNELTAENAETYIEVLSGYSAKLSGLGLEDLNINLDTTTTEQKSKGFLETVTSIFNDGLLALVAEDISVKEISRDNLPSVTVERFYGDDSDSLSSVAAESVLFAEYVLTHFGNYVTASVFEGDTGLDYEVEYILAGKANDKENLASAVEKIALIRTGCNMISLLKSTKMKEEAYILATALVGFTGMPLLIKLMQIVVMTAWSLAESMSDVKTLLSGGKVITIKGDSDWAISVSGLENIGSAGISSKSAKTGFEYKDYLMILLLLQNKSNQTFRTMDLIQANMCENYNEDFRIAECISEVVLQADYAAGQLFVTLPFVKRYVGSGGGYAFGFTQEYSY